jgi:hypothetical protein
LAALAISEKNLTFAPYAFLLLGLLYTKPINALEQRPISPSRPTIAHAI